MISPLGSPSSARATEVGTKAMLQTSIDTPSVAQSHAANAQKRDMTVLPVWTGRHRPVYSITRPLKRAITTGCALSSVKSRNECWKRPRPLANPIWTLIDRDSLGVNPIGKSFVGSQPHDLEPPKMLIDVPARFVSRNSNVRLSPTRPSPRSLMAGVTEIRWPRREASAASLVSAKNAPHTTAVPAATVRAPRHEKPSPRGGRHTARRATIPASRAQVAQLGTRITPKHAGQYRWPVKARTG
jgi:hypothetical protein